LRCNELPN